MKLGAYENSLEISWTLNDFLSLLKCSGEFYFEYENQDLSSGLVEPGPLSSAWVSSYLKISPKEQVEFIQKMVLGALPISYHSFEMTKTIFFKKKLLEGWELYGKTGLRTDVLEDGKSERVRWFVGWIEKDKDFFPFAYQMRAKEVDVNEAIPRVKHLLKDFIVQGCL